MANEEEVMPFEITDQDLDDELNYENRRRPRRSKHSAIYGIWADKSDDESENELDFGKKKTRNLAYSGPIGFVSAGIQKKGDEDDKKEDEEKEDSPPPPDSDSDEEVNKRPSFGRGGGGRKKEKYEVRGGEIAGLRSSTYNPNVSLGRGFGDWEKHTKGIGAKLLLQMGYQAGKGLGKDLQGRHSIIEAFQRKGKGAIGAYGKEGNRPKKVHSDEENEYQRSKSHWRKEGISNNSKVKYVYKSIDQVLDEGWRKVNNDEDENASEIKSRTKVIDMTGKESRILSGYHAIASSKHVPDEDVEMNTELSKIPSAMHFELPELMHNLNMLVDMCEENIISSDRKVKYHKDRIEVLTVEEEKLSSIVNKESSEIHILNKILDALDTIEERHSKGNLSSEDSLQLFTELKTNFTKDYIRYEIPYIASTVVNPILKKELSVWNPLISSGSEKIRNNFNCWKNVLCINPEANSPEEDPYYSILWESWMPKVRTTVNIWQAKVAPDALINFLSSWFVSLVPKWMEDNILLQLVLPKIQNDVNVWNPQTDTVPIHSWLHPWLPLLSNNLEIVYPTIRNKLGNALSNWDPSDRSAKLILLPWKEVFSKGSMHAFLIKYVLPKLEISIQKLIINPHQQDLAPWNAVMEWVDMLPPNVIVGLLEKHFFPKWLQVLATWLNHRPNYNEVTKWYEGWKSIFFPEILVHQQIKHQFGMALDMMSRSVGGVSIAGTPNIPISQPSRPKMTQPPQTIRQPIPMGFRDLVAKRCEENGVLFVPVMPNRFKEGKQIYRCGSLNIYLDRNVIFVQEPNKDVWVPTSLNVLMDNA
ncbi:LOW QUALITY PROTEIN: tuftelin-interacting protein 11 [Lepeophtheirus salmonis]|uniref:LOW QUALITY PROTEIN: tuftelin-interacting protein 11 n=1 Tax=Lepeophtheirus salmonis TaxID=72036 RepID=UPI001AE298AC|nr:LOW QUALITY PROTEIN: tuftelin-interacting protein 11-like [Lepeophtheirus salmonis]